MVDNVEELSLVKECREQEEILSANMPGWTSSEMHKRPSRRRQSAAAIKGLQIIISSCTRSRSVLGGRSCGIMHPQLSRNNQPWPNMSSPTTQKETTPAVHSTWLFHCHGPHLLLCLLYMFLTLGAHVQRGLLSWVCPSVTTFLRLTRNETTYQRVHRYTTFIWFS